MTLILCPITVSKEYLKVVDFEDNVIASDISKDPERKITNKSQIAYQKCFPRTIADNQMVKLKTSTRSLPKRVETTTIICNKNEDKHCDDNDILD